MNYDRPGLLDRLAAEYVFGTMTARARRRFDRLRRALPAAESAARAWETRAGPLAAPVPAVPPPPALWQRIEQRTGGAPTRTAKRAAWLSWWKPALGFAFGIVATLGLVRQYPSAVVTVDQVAQARGELPQSYVGLLTDAQGSPTVLLSSTRHGRSMTIKVLRPFDVPAGKVAQLWALPREGAPFAVGTIPSRDKGTLTLADTSERLFANVPRLAVSLEDAPAAPGATPAPYLLTGHCVKLW